MKKLLTILGVGCLTATTLSSVIACQYVNTVNQSLTNTINSIINNTQGAFYSPILGKHEGLDAIYAKGLISSSKANEIVPQLQSDDKYANSINTYIAQKDLDNFYTELNTNDPTFLGTPIEKNPELDLINTLFSTLYGIIGSNFSVDLASTLTGLLGKATGDWNTVLSVNNMLAGLGTMNDINLLPFPDFNDPDTLVETNAELNWFALVSLYNFLAISTGSEEIIWKDFKKLDENQQTGWFPPDGKGKYLNKKLNELFGKLFKGASKFVFEFNNLNKFMGSFFFSISKYISAFDKYYVKEAELIDNNHIFSSEFTNTEIFTKVRSENYVHIEGDQDISKAFDLFKELLGIQDNSSLETESASESELINKKLKTNNFTLFRGLKILFQSDEDDSNGTFKDRVHTFLPGGGQKWSKPEKTQFGLTPILNGVFGALLKTYIPEDINGILGAIGFGSESLGAVLGNLISNILANNDLSWFFNTALDSLGLLGLVLPSDKIEEIKPILKSIAPMFKNTLSSLVYGDGLPKILELLSTFGIAIPKEINSIKNISSIWDNLILPGTSLKDILNLLIKDPSGLVQFVNKVPALVNSLSKSTIRDRFRNGEFILTNASNQPYKIWFNGDGTTEKVTDIAVALELIRSDRTKFLVWYKDSEGVMQKMSTSTFANYVLGVYERKFVPDTLYSAISQIYSSHSQTFITSLFKFAKNLLDSTISDIDSSLKDTYLSYISPNKWNSKLISYTNFEESNIESELIYEITYKNKDVNVTYVVKLKLPAILNGVSSNYKIESFEQKK